MACGHTRAQAASDDMVASTGKQFSTQVNSLSLLSTEPIVGHDDLGQDRLLPKEKALSRHAARRRAQQAARHKCWTHLEMYKSRYGALVPRYGLLEPEPALRAAPVIPA